LNRFGGGALGSVAGDETTAAGGGGGGWSARGRAETVRAIV
jgi:hypothetical protein